MAGLGLASRHESLYMSWDSRLWGPNLRAPSWYMVEVLGLNPTQRFTGSLVGSGVILGGPQ